MREVTTGRAKVRAQPLCGDKWYEVTVEGRVEVTRCGRHSAHELNGARRVRNQAKSGAWGSAVRSRGGGLTKSHADVLVRSGALSADRLTELECRVSVSVSAGAGDLARFERETRLGATTRTLTAEQVG